MAPYCNLAVNLIFLALFRTPFMFDYNCARMKEAIFSADIAVT